MDRSAPCLQVRAVVSGRVQGVGFRMWTLRRARALGVTGYTCNLDDGAVEVVAEGSQMVLEQFITVLRRGPESAEVRSVQVTWRPCSDAYARFEIRP
jgi:acylphosphatase